MAGEDGYNAWYEDKRKHLSKIPMPMHLIFNSGEHFSGLGKKDTGVFCIVEGSLLDLKNDRRIEFTKIHKEDVFKFSGNLSSTKTPLRVENGKWFDKNDPSVGGKWGMILQGTPSHATAKHSKKLQQPSSDSTTAENAANIVAIVASTLWMTPLPALAWFGGKYLYNRMKKDGIEDTMHDILQWVPVPFIATAWDSGASLFYICTGNTQMAQERIKEAGEDLAWDIADILTEGEADVAREVERGAALAIKTADKSTMISAEEGRKILQSEKEGDRVFNPAADSEEELRGEEEEVHEEDCTIMYGANAEGGSFFENVNVLDEELPINMMYAAAAVAKPKRGIINHSGNYSCVRKVSVKKKTEANHMPPFSCTNGTVYDIGRGKLTALSTEYSLHQGLCRIIGTTGSGAVPDMIRKAIKKHLKNKDLPAALRLQILADYKLWGESTRYMAGLRNAIIHHSQLIRKDGKPFLNGAERKEMLQWLNKLNQREKNMSKNEFFDHCIKSIEQEIRQFF